MPKKIIGLTLIILCGTLLSGCNAVVDLTDEETTLIAEYAADLLLKYDVNYTDRIDEGEKAILEVADEELDTEKLTPDTQAVLESTPITEYEDTEDEVVEQDIAKIAGITGVSITYKDYLLTSKYPAEDEESESVYLEASDGYQLLVLRFRVKNTTQEPVDISMLDREVNYSIVCNESKMAKPMLTILLEDLETLETTVSPEQKQEAVLIFQIADDMEENLASIELKVTYDGTDNVIEVLR